MITNPEVDAYLLAAVPDRDPVLAAMERAAAARDLPIVGPLVGRFLHSLAALSGARRIFEFGSNIGYSTLWWALGAGPNAEVYYTERDPALAAEAAAYFRQAGVADRIRILQGDALERFAATPGEFDLVFLDLDKPLYAPALRLALPRLRPGGLLIADNVLWQGEVAGPARDPVTVAMREFTRLLYATPGLWPVILPLRDGLAVARKEK